MIKLNKLHIHSLRGSYIKKFLYLLVVIIIVFQVKPNAQTCSCAGAPLISSQSLASVSKGNAVVGFTWEHNNISDIYIGTRELTNQTQERTSNTALLEINYGLTDRISFTSTFTFIEKIRKTGIQNPGSSETLVTRGFGDGLFMLKYNVANQSLWNPYQLTIGGGAKIPFATTSLKANGISLNADMQPGTGAWDGVGWILASRALRSVNMNTFVNSSFRLTGENERFNKDDRYKFGNEFVALTGISGAIIDRLSFTFIVKYRLTGSDKRNGNIMPSTGGEWLNIKPGLGYQLADRLRIQLNGEIPLYQKLDGTQPTTSYILSASMFFSLKKLKSGFIYGIPDVK